MWRKPRVKFSTLLYLSKYWKYTRILYAARSCVSRENISFYWIDKPFVSPLCFFERFVRICASFSVHSSFMLSYQSRYFCFIATYITHIRDQICRLYLSFIFSWREKEKLYQPLLPSDKFPLFSPSSSSSRRAWIARIANWFFYTSARIDSDTRSFSRSSFPPSGNPACAVLRNWYYHSRNRRRIYGELKFIHASSGSKSDTKTRRGWSSECLG